MPQNPQFDPDKHERPLTPLSDSTNDHHTAPLSQTSTNASRLSRTVSVSEVRDGIQNQRDVEAGSDSSPEKTEPPKPTDPNLVDWDGADDPKFPKNWSFNKKWAAVACGMLLVSSSSM